MQHVPTVKQASRDLCGPNFGIKDLDTSEWNEEKGDEILPSLQDVCFFGTLRKLWDLVIRNVFDAEFPRQDFIDEAGHGKPSITTALLPRFLCDWMALEGVRSDQERHVNSIEAFRILEDLRKKLYHVQRMKFLVFFEQPEAQSDNSQSIINEHPIGNIIVLSLTVLAEALDHARKFIYKDYAKERSLRFPRPRLAISLLLKAGWCPGEGVHLTGLKATSAYFCSSFDRQRLDQNHTSCTTDQCVADNVTVGDYRTRHVFQECDCQHVAADPPARELRATLLQDGQIPVVQLQEEQATNRMHISTMSSKTATGGNRWYVAISHVWSHGMGNPKANSLPRCQVEKLQTFVNNLYPAGERPIPFWIDTLCVPIEPGLRNKAIVLMKRSYEEAEKVLVIDNSILNVRLGRYPGEPVWRILCSSWMRRLWTFQEGLFARSLLFQFEGVAIKLGHEDMSRFVYMKACS